MNTNTVEEVVALDTLIDAPEVADTVRASSEPPAIRYASDEDVRRASEKVFRLHGRLFEALAK